MAERDSQDEINNDSADDQYADSPSTDTEPSIPLTQRNSTLHTQLKENEQYVSFFSDLYKARSMWWFLKGAVLLLVAIKLANDCDFLRCPMADYLQLKVFEWNNVRNWFNLPY